MPTGSFSMSISASDDSRTVYVARIDELKREQSNGDVHEQLEYSSSPPLTSFFVVVFVFGQFMSHWALLSGHVAAWVAGLIFSLAGITVALFSMRNQVQERGRILQEYRDQLNELSSDEIQSGGLKSKLEYGKHDHSKASA